MDASGCFGNEWVDIDQKMPSDRKSEAERFAERLEACASVRDDVELFGVRYMACPVGADGTELRIGGTYWDKTSVKPFTVASLEYVGVGWMAHDTDQRWHRDEQVTAIESGHLLSLMHDELLHVWQSDLPTALRQDRIEEIHAKYAKMLEVRMPDEGRQS